MVRERLHANHKASLTTNLYGILANSKCCNPVIFCVPDQCSLCQYTKQAHFIICNRRDYKGTSDWDRVKYGLVQVRQVCLQQVAFSRYNCVQGSVLIDLVKFHRGRFLYRIIIDRIYNLETADVFYQEPDDKKGTNCCSLQN